MMERNMTLSEELKKFQKMKAEMDHLWNSLLFETPNRREEEIWEWCERLPKFEGIGRKSPKSKLDVR
jgi:hypothetical protein